MNMDDIADRGLVLLGGGKMGLAMLSGWLAGGLPASAVRVIDPAPSDELRATGVTVGETAPEDPAVLIIAVKPQMMNEALPAVSSLGGGKTLVISVAAGTPLRLYERIFGAETPIVRAMPNTPAAIGQGITAMIGNDRCSLDDLSRAEALLQAVGGVVRLESEDQMDAVTGVSGSGPAYVFHMIEALTAAGMAQGLPEVLAAELAQVTVAGAGALALASGKDVSQLRVDVTSPGGTTQAGLDVLMDQTDGLPPLMQRTVAAAADRSRELSHG
ncbi:pyrroline-5-carboxylate reductase [Aestuariibius insulae]|uniref:pyrroline-5-carboxylate reductase n=1 Tax=Aestuariibius insulae TaxID=2058287 RepID=UPI00345E968E